jgi:8-oxo-dGTP diphosphatase
MRYAGRTATAIIPFSPDKILLIKRRTVPFSGYWALPGGRVDPGEAVEQTIVREVKEETGLDVAIVSKIGDYHEQGVQDGVEYDYYPACFLVKTVGGEIKKQESEIEEIKLFSLSEVPEAMAFEHAQMIKDYIAMRSDVDAKKA